MTYYTQQNTEHYLFVFVFHVQQEASVFFSLEVEGLVGGRSARADGTLEYQRHAGSLQHHLDYNSHQCVSLTHTHTGEDVCGEFSG